MPRRRRAAPDAGYEVQTEEKPRFEMVEVLGRGGMGEVSLVKDNDIRRTVAVKRLLPDQRSSNAMLRFADEVRAVGQLEHPGIVPIYDVGLDDAGQHYLVMKHVQGETLEEVIEKLRAREPAYVERFTHEYRAHVFLEILQAIHYAHDRGILHRDIKPANIMIGPFGEVTVMDWGVAKRMYRNKGKARPPATPALSTKTSIDGKLLETLRGSLVGTPLYMSPEQASGNNDDLDERSDVYSLSLLFYEMLTLEHPLAKHTSLQQLLAVLIATGIDMNALASRARDTGIPAEYFQFIEKGLAHDRNGRFASVAEMETALREVMSGKIPILCHISLTKRLVFGFLHWLDRNPRGFTLLLVLGLAGALAAGLVALLHK